MPDDEKPPKKIEHHTYDFTEPGDLAASKARERQHGPPTFRLLFDQANPTHAILTYGPLALTLTFPEIQGLAEALTGLHAKMVETRADLERAHQERAARDAAADAADDEDGD